MIIVEDVFAQLFGQIPEVEIKGNGYKSKFDFGSHRDLLRWLKTKSENGESKYPLIWLETPVSLSGNTRKKINVKLILATLSNSELSNRDRLSKIIKPTLVPLYHNVIKTLSQSGTTTLRNRNDERYSIHYNYGVNEEETIATDIWDAIKFECEVELYNGCIKQINY